MKRPLPGGGMLLCLLLFCASLALPAAWAGDGEAHEEFNLRRERAPEGNLLNLIFGSAPPMATERGLLLIEAFHDRNGNGTREKGEPELLREVTCRIDGIDYSLPAFIPGLERTDTYRIACGGEKYLPRQEGRSVFFKRRGEIILIELPCREVPAP